MSSVTIATSIAPFNIPHQQSAVRTWLDLGFSVVSLNIEDEIKTLQESFPDISFQPVARDGKALAGRPFVYFDDVIGALKRAETTVCGIINSDIHLNAGSEFLDFILNEAKDAFVFGSRIDVQSFGALDGKENRWGFDLFFFSQDFTQIYPKSQFCLGVPWWDYWAPLVPTLKGLPVKLLVSDVGVHLLHENNWSIELYQKMGDHCLNLVGNQSQAKPTHNRLLEAFTLLVFILSSAKKIYYPHPPQHESCTLADEPETRALLQLLEKVQGLSQSTSETATLKRALQHVEDSVSWKVTRPLRWLKKKILSES